MIASGCLSSRRGALALLTAAWLRLPSALKAEDTDLVRVGISESQMVEVNLKDARAAMKIWGDELKIPMDRGGKLVYTSQEILDGIRKGELDAVSVNILEYRQVADLLDSSQIICNSGAEGFDRYVILVRRNANMEHLADLRGRTLRVLKAAQMCVAVPWLSTVLEERRLGSIEQFFGTVTTDAKASQVVLPVFFGKADACLTLKRGFETICELNPQVAKELSVFKISPAMVVCFFIFRRNYHSPNREKLIAALSGLRTSAAGRQLHTLFQFDDVGVRGADCLAPALGILNAADLARGIVHPGGRK